MTPGARIAAAIEILDRILDGEPAEKALTFWARRSRFAGSKDRAAVRDHVFECLRKRDEFQAIGGVSSSDLSGRSLLLGYARRSGLQVEDIFNGQGHNPAPLTEVEANVVNARQAAWISNLPSWLFEKMEGDLGPDTARNQADALAKRAPITLRANKRLCSRTDLRERLAAERFEAVENPLSDTALTITGTARGLTGTQSFRDGWFEMQDAASQAIVDALPLDRSASILDYCAGGGGKTLAIAAQTDVQITAHDVSGNRLQAARDRAARVGVPIRFCETETQLRRERFDLVLLDAPCSGSGSWRRAPDAKWRFTPDRLTELVALQRQILSNTQSLVSDSGCLAYVTCSIFKDENEAQKLWFLDEFPAWTLLDEKQWLVDENGDGFYLAIFER